MNDTMKTLSRKERERIRHKNEILDAAEVVFIREGYHNASVEAIARDAEFSVGTLYNFFKSKDDLYANVVDRIAQEFITQFEELVLSREEPEQALAALIKLRLSHFEAHRGFIKVFFDASPGSHIDPPSTLPESCREIYQRYLTKTSEIIAGGMESGVFRKANPLYMALCLEGIVNASISYWSTQKTLDPLDVRVDKTSDAILPWLRATSS